MLGAQQALGKCWGNKWLLLLGWGILETRRSSNHHMSAACTKHQSFHPHRDVMRETGLFPLTRSKDGGSWKVHKIFLDKSHSSAHPEINPTSAVSKTYVLNRYVLQARWHPVVCTTPQNTHLNAWHSCKLLCQLIGHFMHLSHRTLSVAKTNEDTGKSGKEPQIQCKGQG